ncbi:unnamed protein product, partial [Amoebophrya sp. A120]|eukprot:GSA120T00014017001.1
MSEPQGTTMPCAVSQQSKAEWADHRALRFPRKQGATALFPLALVLLLNNAGHDAASGLQLSQKLHQQSVSRTPARSRKDDDTTQAAGRELRRSLTSTKIRKNQERERSLKSSSVTKSPIMQQAREPMGETSGVATSATSVLQMQEKFNPCDQGSKDKDDSVVDSPNHKPEGEPADGEPAGSQSPADGDGPPAE